VLFLYPENANNYLPAVFTATKKLSISSALPASMTLH
jgi:hypothetical protein